jgi:hypothetical protein
MPQLAAAGDARRPMDDQGRRDAAFMRPDLVPAERGVRDGGAARPEAKECVLRSRRGGLVVAGAAHHHLGARAIIGEKKDERIVKGAHRFQLLQHAADLAIHAIDHRSVYRLLFRLKALLLGSQSLPRHGVERLAGAEVIEHIGLAARRLDERFRRRELALEQAQFLDSREPLRARLFPPLRVRVAVACDVFRWRLDREVRREKSDVGEERIGCVLLGVFLQPANRVIGNGRGRVKGSTRLNGRQRLVVERMPQRAEVVVGVIEPIGVIEARIGEDARRIVDVPLARMIRAIAGRLEVQRQCARPGRKRAARRILRHLLRVIAGHQRGAGGPAARRVVELREPQPIGRQFIQIRRLDLTAVAA